MDTPSTVRSSREGVGDSSLPPITSTSESRTYARTGIAADPPPERIGPYRILQQLGEGGMGVVYLAEQIEPVRRKVALKLIKLGMDTVDVVARFEAERQALALMQHPNIAMVLDGGATELGRPYFVMELVPGEPITTYCDKHRLSIRERLELLSQVCHALNHAHSHGIIHRDIKPSNILVMLQDGKPVPKLIDFGVAKATDQKLAEHTVFTQLGVLIGTPEYMSPEQAEMTGLDVDAKTDIYSLGVVLYELLVGALPFEGRTLRSAGLRKIQEIIREVDPPRPSTRFTTLGDRTREVARHRNIDVKTLQNQLRGDLDWITMRAMEKDRTRRYETAGQLADDIARFLQNRPVLARPPSPGYRLRRFVRRHRAGVAAGSVLVLCAALIAGLAYRHHRSEEARQAVELRALHEAETARIAQAKLRNATAAAMIRSSNFVGAMEQLEQALRLDPSSEATKANLEVCRRFVAQAGESKEDLEKKLQAADQGIRTAKNGKMSSQYWNQKGVWLRHLGRMDEAIEAHQQGIRADAAFFSNYVSLANTFMLLRQPERAEATLLQCESLPGAPGDHRPWHRWHNLAAVQLLLDRPGAVHAIDKAIRSEGAQSVDVWLLSAKVRLLSKAAHEPSRALEDLIRAESQPGVTTWKIQRLRALAALRGGTNALAIASAEKAITLKDPIPAYASLILSLARADEDRPEARSHYEVAVRDWPAELEKDEWQAELPLGVLWIETLRELTELRDEAARRFKE